jgi:hypothetical protein
MQHKLLVSGLMLIVLIAGASVLTGCGPAPASAGPPTAVPTQGTAEPPAEVPIPTPTEAKVETEVDAEADVEPSAPSEQVTEPLAGASGQPVVAWLGHIASLSPGSQYDDYFALTPAGSGEVGLAGASAEIEEQIKLLRDRQGVGEYVHVWGALACSVADYGGCQITVTRLRYGQILFDPDPVEGWEGTLTTGTFNGRPSKVFVLSGDFPVWHGIDSNDTAIRNQLASLQDTPTVVRVWGELMNGVPDVNGTRIQVSRVEVVGELPTPAPAPTESATEPVRDWAGVIVSNPAGAQFDDYFEWQSATGGCYGIDALDEGIRQQIIALRDTGQTVHLWGTLYHDVPDVQGRQIQVTRLEVQEPTAPPETTEQTVDGWIGTVVKLPPGNQFGHYFERDDGERFDIGATDEALRHQISDARWTGAQIQVWGTLFTGVPATEARHIEVERLDVLSGPAQEARNLTPFATTSASSHLPTDHGGQYQSWMATDGARETAWVEGVAGPGVGEWIELSFPGTIEVHTIAIDVGYDRDADIFAKNNRIKQVTLVFSNGEQVELDFADQRGMQTIPLVRAPGPNITATSVRVVIDEVYPGSKYDDTCLAEIEIWGRAG